LPWASTELADNGMTSKSAMTSKNVALMDGMVELASGRQCNN
jgi:hypothetical protein